MPAHPEIDQVDILEANLAAGTRRNIWADSLVGVTACQ